MKLDAMQWRLRLIFISDIVRLNKYLYNITSNNNNNNNSNSNVYADTVNTVRPRC